ncbi:MAG: extracellular solute-binding protein [Gemmataceae bacterium]|nr:extracellular solute-binding protein [Gemmataceae bacterium]
MSHPTAGAVGSLVALAALVGGLWWREHDARAAPPLVVLVAPTSRAPLEAIAADYERETGRRVELRFGPSEELLTKARLPALGEPADLFLPADGSYVRQARELNLVAGSVPIAPIRAVVLLAPNNPKGIAVWADLTRDGVKVAVPNPGAAVGKVAREHLSATWRWEALRPRVIDTGTVTEAANAAKLGSVDAAVVWDVVAASPAYKQQVVLNLPELDGAVGRVELAVLGQSRDLDAARAFARFATEPERGLKRFAEAGFLVEARK